MAQRIVNFSGGRGSIKLRGPIFDQARREGVLKKGVREGTKKLLPRVMDVVIAKMDKSFIPPEESGAFRRSITMRVYDSGTGVVKSKDNRKIKTWLEARKRKGEKLGRGAYMFQAGKRFARKEHKNGYYQAVIAKYLRD